MLKRKWEEGDNEMGSSDAYNQHLAFCWNQGRNKSNFTMPWDIHMKTHQDVVHSFSQGVKFSGNIPPMPTSSLLREDLTAMVIAEDSTKRSGIPLAKASDAKLWEQKLSWERKCACKKWISLVAEQFTAWEVCRQVATTDALSLGRGNLADSISDCLAAKATGTLHQRANPLLKYVMWWKERGLFPFPIQEAMVYEYIKSRPDDSPSGPKSLLTSISFALHVFGLSGGEVVSKSGRIKGLADSHFCRSSSEATFDIGPDHPSRRGGFVWQAYRLRPGGSRLFSSAYLWALEVFRRSIRLVLEDPWNLFGGQG